MLAVHLATHGLLLSPVLPGVQWSATDDVMPSGCKGAIVTRPYGTITMLDDDVSAQTWTWRPSVASPVCKCTSEELVALKDIGGDFANVYGEITERGFATLAERMRLGAGDVFVDAGSGQGSVVMQAACEFGVRRAVGVEYAASRHDRAVARLACKSQSGDSASGGIASRVSLIQGDCADMARWAAGGELSSCTCAYTCNFLFDEILNARMKQCIESCPSIRCVAAFQPWPDGLVGFSEPYEVRCETSWDPLRSTQVLDVSLGRFVAEGGSTLYVYERRNPLLQRATSTEVNFVVFALTLARVAWVYWCDL